MNIFPVYTYPNNTIGFQANPKTILTKDMVKTMSAADIVELSTATLKGQDINIVRMIRSKIDKFIQILTSEYSYLKANQLRFTTHEIELTKANKSKAQKIEKALSKKIREEKIKKGIEINSGTDSVIPIEYLILPEEEKIHKKIIKMEDLITDKMDADRYKYQRAKHDRNISRGAIVQISKLLKERKNIRGKYQLDIYDIDSDYQAKKMYNNFAEKILFSETRAELGKLQEKICATEIDEFLKNDLLELINRKINI